ncbi:MAG: hypothetical protein PHE53_04650 [Thermoguttaceae bacterium]|nr:hypothetical protein [Thermoguttaceae bacterium]
MTLKKPRILMEMNVSPHPGAKKTNPATRAKISRNVGSIAVAESSIGLILAKNIAWVEKRNTSKP